VQVSVPGNRYIKPSKPVVRLRLRRGQPTMAGIVGVRLRVASGGWMMAYAFTLRTSLLGAKVG